MKKKTLLITSMVTLAFLLAGCSSNKQAATTTTTGTTEISDIDPILSKTGFVREQLTDPALYDYREKANLGVGQIVTTGGSSEEQKKVGRVANFQKSQKYAISGTSRILATDQIEIKSFSYNGGCGPLILGLTNSSNETQILAKVKEISSATSSSDFNISIPSNISLIQFDSIGVYCPTKEEPVSMATFQ
jgi:hypothetical protein